MFLSCGADVQLTLQDVVDDGLTQVVDNMAVPVLQGQSDEQRGWGGGSSITVQTQHSPSESLGGSQGTSATDQVSEAEAEALVPPWQQRRPHCVDQTVSCTFSPHLGGCRLHIE